MNNLKQIINNVIIKGFILISNLSVCVRIYTFFINKPKIIQIY